MSLLFDTLLSPDLSMPISLTRYVEKVVRKFEVNPEAIFAGKDPAEYRTETFEQLD